MNRRITLAALYAGGFLGPFAGGITTSMLPELGQDYGVSTQAAAYSLTAYLVPFAALMLFSGTLGARWGASRSVRVAYLVYVVASLGCALAEDYPLFLVARAVQGGANAFTTPLLLAAVATITPPERLGRTLGLFSSLQAAGQTSAPLLGGLAAEANWRIAFVGVAVVSAALALAGLPEQMRERQETRVTLRSAWRPAVLRAGWVALVGWACLGGMSVLLALRAQDVFGLGAAERGLVLTGFGVVGLLSARPVGRGIDRIGARRAVLIGSVAGAVPIALVGTLTWLPAVVALWALTGVAAQLLLVGVNALVLSGEGPNRAGAVSVVQSMRFTGAALSPLAFTPLYRAEPVLGFLVPAALVAVTAPVLLAVPSPSTSERDAQ
ncbi:MFS transporter [Actinokineospora sp. NBRC 105648]|uniref:MFS transporter n=1 Tax=Actinokineospora sp. NBRC 105648 TaxID=3032206 RepID=UPI0024A3E391|nr:MFS transporter [Actinokineospora sp. NBRC 105648]GLZ37324.1 MFS transporter [Actinokineospora sp. NBRC 105648]